MEEQKSTSTSGIHSVMHTRAEPSSAGSENLMCSSEEFATRIESSSVQNTSGISSGIAQSISESSANPSQTEKKTFVSGTGSSLPVR